jgi:CDP-diacylglycerol--serine O-phosphatidyltransferase
LAGPEAFRITLLDLIARAQTRIMLAALYLQDDDMGRELLAALHAAKAARPNLEIAVLVDWHRAQRGLIGKQKSAGNAALYCEMTRGLGPGVPIYGVPVQTRELMGVMHLKGFVIDDQVLYSGASLNDVYLQRHERYRLDRYHLLRSAPLADSLAELLTRVFLADPAVHRLDEEAPPSTASLRNSISRFRRRIKRAHYTFNPGRPGPGELGVTPLLGLGRAGNELNSVLLQVAQRANRHLVMFTPYFNLPRPLRKVVKERLQAGCQVSIILGDKTANDFFISTEEPFKAIGILPYLYEANLRRFCKTHQAAIRQGLLNIHLWRDGTNTFHIKGLRADEEWTLITGNNLNPRAWWLDLENGLLIRDPQSALALQHSEEIQRILKQTQRLKSYKDLETMKDYPLPVQRLLKRLSRPRLDRLLNQIM